MCEPGVTPPLPCSTYRTYKHTVLDVHVSLLFDNNAIIARFVPHASHSLLERSTSTSPLLPESGSLHGPVVPKITAAISTQAIRVLLMPHIVRTDSGRSVAIRCIASTSTEANQTRPNA